VVSVLLHCCVSAYRRGDVLGGTEFDGVAQKVDDDLLDSVLVAVDDLVLYIVRLENDFNFSELTFELHYRNDLCDGIMMLNSAEAVLNPCFSITARSTKSLTRHNRILIALRPASR